jgi:3-oxoacyl-[acyl-carrier protein] reductase
LNRKDFENIFALNINSNYELIKNAHPFLAENKKSTIVNISSVAGLRGLGSSVAYAASKGALNTMTLALSRSLGSDGIRVNAVCPGFVATDWWKNSLGDEKFKKAISAYEKTNPLGECPSAEDIVGSILFFASDLSNHVTGQLLAVDGGLLIGMPLKLD